MDFFEAQDQARRRTKWLVLWFFLSVGSVILAVDTLIFFTLGQSAGSGLFWLLIISSIATGGLILLASGYKSMQLSAGGSVVAKDLGGRLVMSGTIDHEEKRLLNIVEEMAIASGMPVPQVYLMDDEEGINAFAAGTEPSNAVIGVTRGTLQRLSRAELEGVIAHEFSHILNGDMRLNMRLIGLVFGLVVISIVGRGLVEMLRFQSLGRRRDKGGGGIMLALFVIGIGLMLIGSIGVFFGRLIQSAISRQREYLADASAVQFTRNPDGIAGALKKIGGLSLGGKMIAPKASEASHMMFSDAGLFSFGLATHPPLDVRIKAIQANWDGKFSESSLSEVPEGHFRKEQKKGGVFPIPEMVALSAVEQIGDESRWQISSGSKICEDFSEKWKSAMHDREKAQALIFGLLLSEDQELCSGEKSFLRNRAGEGAAELAFGWKDEVAKLHSARKIALIDLTIPALKSMSRLEYDRFVGVTHWLIANDGKVDLFEFMIQRVVVRHLSSHFERVGFGKVRYKKISQLTEEAHLIVSTIAGLGAGSIREREVAYRSAADKLDLKETSMADPTSLKILGGMLDRFENASPIVKKELLIACGHATAADGDLTSHEAELLRAIADSIGCPLPPFLEALEETAN